MDFFNAFENGRACSCGTEHSLPTPRVLVGGGVIERLADEVKKTGARKAFVISDKNTYRVAGKRVCELIKDGGLGCVSYTFSADTVEPNEEFVGSAIMHYEGSCDIVIGVGSGVINDISKIVSAVAKTPYIIVATAPSMDGFASATSSMTRDGLKVSLPSKCADVIIGDTDILKNAPLRMLKAGLGDMIAKYTSICDWRLSHLITGEYYCEMTAQIVRDSLKKCSDNAQGLLKRDEKAVEAVFEGLVLCGAAMAYVGVSRPASGVEHYFSHVWDMRGVEFGIPVDLHGNQCAVGTYIACGLYEKLKGITPNREKALKYAEGFDYAQYSQELLGFLGKGAESMIALEEKEGKYDRKKHGVRLDRIIENWDEILQIINEELPSRTALENLFGGIGLPKSLSDVGVEESVLKKTFFATKDIRDKYVLSRLAWDLGIIEELL